MSELIRRREERARVEECCMARGPGRTVGTLAVFIAEHKDQVHQFSGQQSAESVNCAINHRLEVGCSQTNRAGNQP